jgi:hypothetical protein
MASPAGSRSYFCWRLLRHFAALNFFLLNFALIFGWKSGNSQKPNPACRNPTSDHAVVTILS